MHAEVVEMTDVGKVVGALEAAGDVTVERALVGAVSAHNVRFEMAGAGPVLASGDVSFERAGCGPVITAGDVRFKQGGCGPVIAAGSVSFEQGGARSVIAGTARLGAGSFALVVAAPKVEIADGARVLLGTKQAAALGAALGAVLGLVLLRKRG
jgi:hypothetical protein